MELKTLDPQSLHIFSNDRDILRDLFTYLDYVRERSVKRMTRSNEIPSADMKRLAKLLNVDLPEKDDWMYARQHWIYFIDDLALRLNLVFYDIKGEYRGYTSSEPSYIDNYIIVEDANLQKFIEISPAGQEKRIRDTLIHAKSHSEYSGNSDNEFYKTSVLGELDTFYQWGAATGLMPTLKFPEIRLFLLGVLENLSAGEWYSTQSLIAWLKANHPYFLIPQNSPKKDRWGHPIQRYGNFYEGKEQWVHNEKPIPDDAPDGFERVEGRYVERFLEGIPLLMRFVDVAYDTKPYTGPLPMRGVLKAFRINERFQRLMRGKVAAPKVTVQPNFEVVIESDFYPAQLVHQIAALGEQVSNPSSGQGAFVGIFQLDKTSVAAAQVQNPDLDVIALLKDLSKHELPANVQIELEEWAGHADQFTLYQGFGLLEMADLPPEVEKFVAERVTPALSLVRAPQMVFSKLETIGRAPLRVKHGDQDFAPIAESAQTVFPKESVLAEAQETAKQVKVSRTVTIRYEFPDDDSFTSIQKMLAELRCPFRSDPVNRTVNIQQKEQDKFDEAVQQLKDTFDIEIE
ncbi:MAG: hypothetical protein PVJ21_11370 [Anaerolineales bacterium]|jgi:hypothetical protein